MDSDASRSIPTPAEQPSPIVLERMSQQIVVRAPKDDWTGITSAVERRKLQNRLNQRIYRKRRAAPKVTNKIHKSKVQDGASSSVGNSQSDSGTSITRCSLLNFATTSHEYTADPPELSGSISKQTKSLHDLSSVNIREAMARYERLARQEYVTGSPRADQLFTLIQFNVCRALFSNSISLGFTIDMEWIDENAISLWYSRSPQSADIIYPTSLAPTPLQKTISHHPWIDFWPFPRMRDNLLLAGDSYDELDLCNDLVDFFDITNENTGLIVWNEPWDPSGWEASETFLVKWGWVVKGCDDLAKSTNYWRALRGEKPLCFHI